MKNENRLGYKKTKVGWIPGEWECVQLGRVVSLNCNTLTSSTASDYKFYYLDLSCIEKGIVRLPENMITFGEAPCRARRQCKIGDVLLATVRPNLKGFGYIDLDINDLVASTGYAVLRSNKKVVSQYVYHNLFSYYTEKHFLGCVVGSNYPALNNSDIKSLRIPLPSLSEQKRISEVLSCWDDSIEKLNKLILAKQKHKKALMQKLLTGKKRFKEFEKTSWQKIKFSHIFKRVTRKNSEQNDNILTISAQHGLISQYDFYNKRVASANLSNYTLLKNGEFAYNKSYSTGYPMGAVKRLDMYEKGVVSSLYICFALSSNEVDSEFISQYFESGNFNHEIYKIAQEGARNHGLLNISVPDFFHTDLFLPTLPEQKKIAAVLKNCDEEIDLLKEKLAKLKSQKKGLMQKLLTGEIRVKV